MKKGTIRLVQPAKTQISLHIHIVWSVFTDNLCLIQPLGCLGYPKRNKQEPLLHWVAVLTSFESLLVTQVLL